MNLIFHFVLCVKWIEKALLRISYEETDEIRRHIVKGWVDHM